MAHLSLHALLLTCHEVIERVRVGVEGPSRSTTIRQAQKHIVFMKTSVDRYSGLHPRCGRLGGHSRKGWLNRRRSVTWSHLKPHTLLSWIKGPFSKCTMSTSSNYINTSWIVRIRWQLCGVTSTCRVCWMHPTLISHMLAGSVIVCVVAKCDVLT